MGESSVGWRTCATLCDTSTYNPNSTALVWGRDEVGSVNYHTVNRLATVARSD